MKSTLYCQGRKKDLDDREDSSCNKVVFVLHIIDGTHIPKRLSKIH